jgi:hypothetical protein
MGTFGAAGNGQLGNWLAPYQLCAVCIFKSIALATALMVGISTLADAAGRQRSRTFSASGAYRA